MTTYKDLLIDDLNRAYERFERAFEGVTVVQANAFPVAEFAPQVKSMTWLLWHTAMVLDIQIAELAGTDCKAGRTNCQKMTRQTQAGSIRLRKPRPSQLTALTTSLATLPQRVTKPSPTLLA